MSDRAVQKQCTNMKQSAWIGHWMQPKYKRTRDGYLCLENKDRCETKQHSLSCNQVSEPSGSKAVTGPREGAESRSMEVINKIMTDGRKERSDLLSFPIFNIHKKGGTSNKQVLGAQTGHWSEFNAATTGTIKPHSAYTFGRQMQEMGIATVGCDLLPKEITPNLELELRARDSVEGGCMPTVKFSRGKLLDVPSDYPYGIMHKKEKVIPFASTSKEHITHRSSYHDFNIDTMRISTLDAQEDTHLGPPMYTETTRHFFITEKMAIGMSDEGTIFRESMLSSKFNGNLGEFLSLSPASGQVRPGFKLQLLDGSTDSGQKGRDSEENQKDEGSRSVGRLNTIGGLTDETSAETRTTEVDASLDYNQTYGLAVSRSNKAALRGHSTASSQGKSTNIGLPDMNEVAHTPDGSANEGGTSTSRTQSLDMECLFSNHDHPSNSKSIPSHVVHPRSELGSSWVKRLKLSSSYTKHDALGTKSSTIEEASSYEKLRKLSSNLFNRSISLTNSEPTMDICLRNTSEMKKIALSNGGNGSSIDSKEDRNVLLSHSWIRRWRHDPTTSPKKQPITTEPSETPKAGFDHFQKKSFPSIAAMALMGKAMNGFRPCEFTKKGSFIVWDTNNLPND